MLALRLRHETKIAYHNDVMSQSLQSEERSSRRNIPVTDNVAKKLST